MTADQVDQPDPLDGFEFEIGRSHSPIRVYRSPIEMWFRRALCAMFGHEPDMDHCGRPEHDFCWSCNKPMPGMAPRRREARDV